MDDKLSVSLGLPGYTPEDLFPFQFKGIVPQKTSTALTPYLDSNGVQSYLIFVIFLHGQNFWRIKFTPKKTRKLQQNTQ